MSDVQLAGWLVLGILAAACLLGWLASVAVLTHSPRVAAAATAGAVAVVLSFPLALILFG